MTGMRKILGKVVRRALQTPLVLYHSIRSIYYLRKQSRTPKTGNKIRVGFIVQVPEIWDKEVPVYEAMLEDTRFEPQLIVVPSYDQITGTILTTYENNYFIEQYPNAVRAFSNGNWLSFADVQFDYVFLQRPYDYYLPQGIRSSDLVKYTKLCYIPYAYVGSDNFEALSKDMSFFRNIYIAFMESENSADCLRKRFIFFAEKKLHRILNLGYPALLPYLSFPENKEIKRILWTPRWSYDSKLGGSNFLENRDAFIELAKKHPECQFAFRPHPLMFGEFLKKGYMSQNDIDVYLERLHIFNIRYDVGIPLYDSLKNTDLLITDFSSIIIQYYLTGRPIVYCKSQIELNDSFKKMEKGMYVVDSPIELIETVNSLLGGDDPQKAARLSSISSEFSFHKNAIENIVGYLREDYFANA